MISTQIIYINFETRNESRNESLKNINVKDQENFRGWCFWILWNSDDQSESDLISNSKKPFLDRKPNGLLPNVTNSWFKLSVIATTLSKNFIIEFGYSKRSTFMFKNNLDCHMIACLSIWSRYSVKVDGHSAKKYDNSTINIRTLKMLKSISDAWCGRKFDGSSKNKWKIWLQFVVFEKYRLWSSRTFAHACLKVTGYEFGMGKVNEF